jgi:hypothetical protein
MESLFYLHKKHFTSLSLKDDCYGFMSTSGCQSRGQVIFHFNLNACRDSLY